MILTDAGPLVALINRTEPDHQRCLHVLEGMTDSLLVTWPVMTEAMHLLGRAAGWAGQRALWSMVERDAVRVHELQLNHQTRMIELMLKYRDRPMDLADASLVALAEDLEVDRVFSLDSDFHIYRLFDRRAFSIVP